MSRWYSDSLLPRHSCIILLAAWVQVVDWQVETGADEKFPSTFHIPIWTQGHVTTILAANGIPHESVADVSVSEPDTVH